MIESVQNQQNQLPPPDKSRAILRYREEDTERTAGSMPVWERPASAEDEITDALAEASERAEKESGSFASALSYVEQNADKKIEAFGFGDLIDMINPLQHIPLVNHLYRDMTGDEIRPVSRIIGSSIYGGPIGGAAALANIAVEYETGKDVTANVFAMVTGGKGPGFRSVPDVPEQRLDSAARSITKADPVQELPGSMLSFADLGGGRKRIVERFSSSDPERTAGTMVRNYIEEPAAQRISDFLPPREAISALSFAPMAGIKTERQSP